MTHETRMAIQLSLPSAATSALALLFTALSWSWSDKPFVSAFSAQLDSAAWWSMVAALLLAAVGLVRLFRWERGHGLSCDSCGCLLGRERDGVRNRGPYRKCLGCQRNTPQREYALSH